MEQAKGIELKLRPSDSYYTLLIKQKQYSTFPLIQLLLQLNFLLIETSPFQSS